MASIERMAYSRFRRAVSVRELHESFPPGLVEIEWARELTRSPEHCLALVVWLKSFQRLGYFPDLFEVPIAVVEHVRRYLGRVGVWSQPTTQTARPSGTGAGCGSVWGWPMTWRWPASWPSR